MSEPRAPERWLTDPSIDAELRSAMATYAASGPSDGQRERMALRITDMVGGELDAPPTPSVAGRPQRWPWIGGALLGLLIVGLSWMRSGSHEPAPPGARPAHPGVEPRQVESAAPPQPERAQPMETPAEPVAEPARRRVRATSPAKSGTAPAAADAGEELRLLTPARKLLAADAQRSLALADEHASRFEHGLFAEEREVIRIEALHRLGRDEAMRASARRFLRSHPNSTQRTKVTQLLEAP